MSTLFLELLQGDLEHAIAYGIAGAGELDDVRLELLGQRVLEGIALARGMTIREVMDGMRAETPNDLAWRAHEREWRANAAAHVAADAAARTPPAPNRFTGT